MVMLSEDDLRGLNCAVQALAILCRLPPDEVVRRLDSHAGVLGEPSAFVEHKGCLNRVVDSYLASLGWSRWKRQGPDYRMIALPPTCLVQMPLHVFAMIDGFVWNAWADPPSGFSPEILGFWRPSTADIESAITDFRASESW